MPLDPSERVGSGQNAQELAAADWLVRHRLTMRSLGYAGLGVWIALSWGYGIWTLFDAYALSYPKEQRYVARIAGTALAPDAATVTAPAPFEIGGTQALAGGGERQHLFAPVHNPNTLWWASVRYRFRDGTVETPARTAAFLPGETRILTELGWEKAALRSPSLSIESIDWKRIDPTVTGGDYAGYERSRLTLAIDKPAYQGDIEIEGKRIGQASFTLRNPAGYPLRNVELLALLYRGAEVAGIGKLVLTEVAAGANQELNLVWPDNPTGISRVEVRPFVNILDPATFAGAGRE